MTRHFSTARAAAITAVFGLALAGCSAPAEEPMEDSSHAASADSESPAGAEQSHEGASEGTAGEESGGHGAHAADGGAPPEGIETAADPKFDVGDTVVLSADHMPGMKGAEATVSEAFDTWTYSISYTPSDGGETVTDHKWVVQQELEDPSEPPLAEGTEVTVNADHMPGMKGVTATIDSATDETVYMVDLSVDGMEMTNHKWVVESEMAPAQG